MIFLALAAAAFAILVMVGRRPSGLQSWLTLAIAGAAAAAALAAVFVAIRGQWAAALALAALALWIGQSARPVASPALPTMDERQARSILGVSADATEQQIQDAWKRLMRQAHPDQGGTEGLAAQLNAARDALISRRG